MFSKIIWWSTVFLLLSSCGSMKIKQYVDSSHWDGGELYGKIKTIKLFKVVKNKSYLSKEADFRKDGKISSLTMYANGKIYRSTYQYNKNRVIHTYDGRIHYVEKMSYEYVGTNVKSITKYDESDNLQSVNYYQYVKSGININSVSYMSNSMITNSHVLVRNLHGRWIVTFLDGPPVSFQTNMIMVYNKYKNLIEMRTYSKGRVVIDTSTKFIYKNDLKIESVNYIDGRFDCREIFIYENRNLVEIKFIRRNKNDNHSTFFVNDAYSNWITMRFSNDKKCFFRREISYW